jgi:microcystin-dependent protein
MSNVQPGTVIIHTNNSIPEGWLLCDGSEYSQAVYNSLYTIISNRYNFHPSLGNPSSGNFRVPDLRDVFPMAKNAAGPAGTTTLGTYNTTGWNHTHTLPAHSHGLNSHTHTITAHSHGIPSHNHNLNGHTHAIGSHTHTVYAHNHIFPNHAHSHNLQVDITHYHNINTDTTGTTSNTAYYTPRSGASATNKTMTTGGAKMYINSASGTVGAGSLNLSTTTGYLDSNTAFETGPNTATLLANSTTTGTRDTLTTGNPLQVSGLPNSSTTNTDGLSTTGSANPPYFGIHFIIKA